MRIESAEHLEKLAVEVAAYDELWMNHEIDRDVVAGKLLCHRVDEEGHVVGDDLDQRVGRPTGQLVRRERDDPHLRRTGRA